MDGSAGGGSLLGACPHHVVQSPAKVPWWEQGVRGLAPWGDITDGVSCSGSCHEEEEEEVEEGGSQCWGSWKKGKAAGGGLGRSVRKVRASEAALKVSRAAPARLICHQQPPPAPPCTCSWWQGFEVSLAVQMCLW